MFPLLFSFNRKRLEIDNSVFSLCYGKCRFCLTKGRHKDIMKEYNVNGIREIYYELFQECFKINLSKNSVKGSLICSTCIRKLREACGFRWMVVNSEKELKNTLDEKEMLIVDSSKKSPKIPLQIQVEIKAEAVDVNYESSATEPNSRYSVKDYMSEDETDSIKPATIVPQLEVDIKSEPTDENYETSGLERNNVISNENDTVLDIEAETKTSTDSICPTLCDDDRSEKLDYIHNMKIILENSNVTPFKPKQRKGFTCFYCQMIFEEFIEMKEHQREHAKSELKDVLSSFSAENFVMYVDVTDLKCTICHRHVQNLIELKKHLNREHNKKLLDIPDRVVPFKIAPNVFECQICKCHFDSFESIEHHMNVHFRNYICNECDACFITKCRLKAHLKCHTGRNFHRNMFKKQNLHVGSRMIDRHKYDKCDERFTKCYSRQEHIVKKHTVAPKEYRCSVCDKRFHRKYMLLLHIKRNHLRSNDNVK